MFKTELVKLLERFEGFVPKVYKDVAGIDTIGIGTLWKNGMPTEVTHEQAVDLCWKDCEKIVKQVDSLVTVKLTENQRIALVSFAYNVGTGALASSTLLKFLNQGNYAAAADEFTKWDKAKVNGTLQSVTGLYRRRKIERERFLTPDNPPQS